MRRHDLQTRLLETLLNRLVHAIQRSEFAPFEIRTKQKFVPDVEIIQGRLPQCRSKVSANPFCSGGRCQQQIAPSRQGASLPNVTSNAQRMQT